MSRLGLFSGIGFLYAFVFETMFRQIHRGFLLNLSDLGSICGKLKEIAKDQSKGNHINSFA
jgi:hypothetical protein